MQPKCNSKNMEDITLARLFLTLRNLRWVWRRPAHNAMRATLVLAPHTLDRAVPENPTGEWTRDPRAGTQEQTLFRQASSNLFVVMRRCSPTPPWMGKHPKEECESSPHKLTSARSQKSFVPTSLAFLLCNAIHLTCTSVPL